MTSFEGPGRIARRRAPLLLASITGYAGFVLGVIAGAPVWTHLVAVSVASACIVAWTLRAWPSRLAGRLRGDPQGLSMNGRPIVERRHIDAATTFPPQTHVRIWRKWRAPVDVELDSEADAAALVQGLGLAAEQSIATFWATVGSGSTRGLVAAGSLLVALGVLWALHGHLGPGNILMFPLVVLPNAVLGLGLQARVSVGSDGILIRRLLARSRFVPYASVESVKSGGREIIVRLRAGERMVLRTGHNRAQTESREALAARIEEARAAYAGHGNPREAEALLAPGGRPIATWLREVRMLASGREYRAATLGPEQLFRVAADASAPAATRAAAVLALAPTLDGGARARLRVASEACANPELRVAMLRVADGASAEEIDEAVTAVAELG